MTNPLFTCSFLKHFENIDKETIEEDYEISLEQLELRLRDNNPRSIVEAFQQFDSRPEIAYNKKVVNYTAKYSNIKDLDLSKTPALIPAKDSLELLRFTFSNLKNHNVFEHIVPVLIDDRSTRQEEMRNLADEYSAIYIRMDYDSPTFNFSVINNAAAAFLKTVGYEDVILWNSDLWVDNDKVIPYLLNKHKSGKEEDFYATGVKLLYPTRGFCELMDDEKFITSLAKDFNITPAQIESYNPFGSIQFGGSSFVITPFLKRITPIVASPVHFGRFTSRNAKGLNIDKQVHFMTGAFILCDLEKFEQVGGLNPSMNSQFQDVDLCLKLNAAGSKIMFYGKDVHLLHAESMSLSSKAEESAGIKTTPAFRDDMVTNQALYATVWNPVYLYGNLGI